MGKDITKELESLAGLSRSEFRGLWTQYFGWELANPSRRDILVRLLAYRMQEHATGGLAASTRKRLLKLAEEIAADPAAEVIDAPRIKAGTRLLREWHGEMHTVTVTERGFNFGDKEYRSLTEIAKLITGTKWSGPFFFGLRTPRAVGPGNGHAG